MLVLSSSECTFETCRRTVKMSARWREADVGQIPTSAKHQAQALAAVKVLACRGKI